MPSEGDAWGTASGRGHWGPVLQGVPGNAARRSPEAPTAVLTPTPAWATSLSPSSTPTQRPPGTAAVPPCPRTQGPTWSCPHLSFPDTGTLTDGDGGPGQPIPGGVLGAPTAPSTRGPSGRIEGAEGMGHLFQGSNCGVRPTRSVTLPWADPGWDTRDSQRAGRSLP